MIKVLKFEMGPQNGMPCFLNKLANYQYLEQVLFEVLLQMQLESGLALEGLVALVAVHLSLGVSRQMSDIRGLD